MKTNQNLHPFAVNAGFLDIETFGLEKGSPVWEAAWYDLQTGNVRKWSIKPHAGSQGIDVSKAADFMEPWTRNRYMGLPSYKKGIAASLASGTDPKTFLRELFSEVQGKQVWIANAPFESRQLGEMARTFLSEQERVQFSKQFQTAPASKGALGNLFYVTGRNVQAARGAAYRTGDWSGVVDAYAKTTIGNSTVVRDVQDVARSVFSQAMDLGILSNRGSYVGSSVNMLGMAMGQATETHRAADDVVQEAKILFGDKSTRGLLGLNERLSGLNQGFLGAIGALFSPGTSDDLTVLKRMEAVRPALKVRSIDRSFADARLDILEGKGVEIVTGRRTWNAPVYAHGSPFVRSTPISVANKAYTKDWDKAVAYLSSVHMNGSDGIDLQARADRVAQMPKSALEGLRHFGVSLAGEESLNADAMRRMTAAGRWGVADSLKMIGKRYPVQSIATAGLTLAGVDGLTALMSPEEDDRLVVEGLNEMGVAQELRKQNTEFGSGYQGLGTPWFFRMEQEREYRATQANYEKMVWQEPGRNAVQQMMIKEAQKKAQAKLGRLSEGAGESYTPDQVKAIQEASGGSLFHGINPQLQKRINVIDISADKYKYYFDDADTLQIRKRGFLGIPMGKKVSIRLAGVDSPEVGGHEGDALAPVRIAQEQPHGQTSAEQFKEIIKAQGSLTLAYDPEATTYGRHIGFLYGEDMQNINLQLVRGGQAGHLPFGDAGSSIVHRGEFQRAEDSASHSQRGMWSDPFWQAYKLSADQAGTRITFNTMTRMDKLAKDAALQQMTFSAWRAHERGYIEDEGAFVEYGQRLRSTYGRFNSRNKKRAKRKGNHRAHNDIQGLQHGGMASANRPLFGFGSPWLGAIPKKVLQQIETGGHTWQVFDEMLGWGAVGEVRLARSMDDPEKWAVFKSFKKEGAEDSLVYNRRFSNKPEHQRTDGDTMSELGWDMRQSANSSVIGALVDTLHGVRERVGNPKLSQVSAEFEGVMHKEASNRLGKGYVPEYYGHGKDWVMQEYAGLGLKEAISKGHTTPREATRFIDRFLSTEMEKGIFHTDLHMEQVMFDPVEKAFRVADWGSSVLKPKGFATRRIMQQGEEMTRTLSRSSGTPAPKKKRVGTMKDISDTAEVTPQMRSAVNRRRRHKMATAQNEASRSLFRSPIKHSYGGS